MTDKNGSTNGDLVAQPAPFKRMAAVEVSLEFLSEILSGRIEFERGVRIETDAPEDLQVLALHSVQSGTVQMVCESETFEPVLHGMTVPVIDGFEYTLIYLDEHDEESEE